MLGGQQWIADVVAPPSQNNVLKRSIVGCNVVSNNQAARPTCLFLSFFFSSFNEHVYSPTEQKDRQRQDYIQWNKTHSK